MAQVSEKTSPAARENVVFFSGGMMEATPQGLPPSPCPRAAGFALGVQGVGLQGAGLKLLPPRSTLQDAAPLQGVFAPQETSRPPALNLQNFPRGCC